VKAASTVPAPVKAESTKAPSVASSSRRPVQQGSPSEELLVAALTCRLAVQARDWPLLRRQIDRALDQLVAVEAALPPAGTPPRWPPRR